MASRDNSSGRHRGPRRGPGLGVGAGAPGLGSDDGAGAAAPGPVDGLPPDATARPLPSWVIRQSLADARADIEASVALDEVAREADFPMPGAVAAELSTAAATRALARLWHLTLEYQVSERGLASGLEPGS